MKTNIFYTTLVLSAMGYDIRKPMAKLTVIDCVNYFQTLCETNNITIKEYFHNVLPFPNVLVDSPQEVG